MKITVYLHLISYYFHLTGAKLNRREEQFVPLIKSIRGYYSASAIFLLNSKSEFNTTVIFYVWSRILERQQIQTLSTNFKNIHALKKHNNNLRSMIIVFITGLQDVHEFSRSTKYLNMSLFAWFVIFVSTKHNDANDYCYAPSGNLFHLLFDTEMLVMCINDPVIREWHSVDGNNTEIFDLMRWRVGETSPVQLLSNLSLYERRNNLRGKVLRAVTVKGATSVSMEHSKLYGHFSRVIAELQNVLNFTLDVVDNVLGYGSFNTTTQRWSGAMRLVASGEADIGISDFSMTSGRLAYVDFTVPIETTRNCLYLKQPETFMVKWFAYYKIFSVSLWLNLIAMEIIASFALAFIRSRVESCDTAPLILEESIRVWGIFCQQGIGESPRNVSLRVAYFTLLVTGIVTIAAYSASLVSFVTASSYDVPFSTVEELINDGTYNFIVRRDSSDYDMFVHSTNPVVINLMKLLMPYHKLPYNTVDGLQSICNDTKLAFYTAYLSEAQKRSQGLKIPCRIYCINFGPVDSLSMILSKDNQYTTIINNCLQKLLNAGILSRFKNMVYTPEQTKFRPVGLFSAASVLLIFFCGVVLALVILIIELYRDRYKNIQDLNRALR